MVRLYEASNEWELLYSAVGTIHIVAQGFNPGKIEAAYIQSVVSGVIMGLNLLCK